jgi:N-ethylmaleimide reductase
LRDHGTSDAISIGTTGFHSGGGLIISEATNISLTSRGWLGSPGVYSDQQVAGWKKVVSGVQAKGGHMMAQLWHTGRSSHVAMTGGATPV